jgi:alpha-mannosidase
MELAGPMEPPPLEPDVDDSSWRDIPAGTYWGGQNINFVMRGQFSVHADADRKRPLALYLPLGDGGDFSHPEALAYIDGAAYATTDRHHQEFLLAPQHCDGAAYNLVLHGWTGLLDAVFGKSDKQLFMRQCAIVEIDTPTREFVAAARTALEAADLLDGMSPTKTRLYNVLDHAFMALDTREPLGDAFYESVPAALEVLREGIADAGEPLDVEIIAAGHAHIDVAWLWTLGQTRRKAGRSFYTAARLMEQFPDYHFTQSQPQLYDYVRQDYPDLFETMKARVREGRWEPIGGMWVEADCNISGPESLARQFLIGRSFFREHFGEAAESPVLWLPDVFGYAWNLPQLIKLAGLEYFFTIKIGWNQVNKMPYDSFWWQGLDGTKVLTHFSTAPEVPWHGHKPDLMNSATYNANLSAFTALGSWAKLKHKESQSTMLMSYGYGDGGGGPTREMNENALELKAFPGLPRLRQGKVIDFFRRLEEESADRLPTWNSELYLEIHRGTYTTQSRNKRANRKSEFLLHDAEFLAAYTSTLDPTFSYPYEAFRQAWELVCLNQFHDIIPGSSIGEVYVESQTQYVEVRRLAEGARDAALDSLAAQVEGDVLLANPTGFSRDDLAFWPGELPDGKGFADGVLAQQVDGGVLIACLGLEPYSVGGLQIGDKAPTSFAEVSSLRVEPGLLENEHVRVELNAAGDITRIYDKAAAREVLPEGAIANQWQAFEDRPVNWDAWDIDIFYDDKTFLAEPAEAVRVVEAGPLRATLEIERRILGSRYTQRISLAYNSPQIDISTVIDWREKHIMLKAAFPVDVLSPAATYEVQWGNVQRPTHRNTSWDWARFETCAQKWVDLSEGGYGVALLNDCKYGHDIRDNIIRITLLRSPTQPDPSADQGEHHFTYSLFPHAHDGHAPLREIARRAYLLNDPIIATNGRSKGSRNGLASLVKVSGSTIVETVKRAEDGNGLIVRFYECNRQRGPIMLEAAFPVKEAHTTNLLEESMGRLEVDGHKVMLDIKPYQIVTVRLVPQR